MDAHVFRLVAGILATRLHKARLERVHEPVPGITAFSLFASGSKQCLIFRWHRSAPMLFLMDKSPFSNPAFPPAFVMRLRKYAEGRILGEARWNWPERQLAFALPGSEGSTAGWLLLDCRNGPSIVKSLPDAFDAPPAWPEASRLPGLLREEGGAGAPWKDFRVLTPFLRRTLAAMDEPDAAALLVDLEAGSGDLFWYSPLEDATAPPHILSAWPLPPGLEDAGDKLSLRETVTPPTAEAVLPRLEAMFLPILLAEAKTQTDAPALKQDRSAGRKRKRLLARLEEERTRLHGMLALGDAARLIQAHLWRLSPDERRESVTLPLDPAAPDGESRTISLNPLISVTDNMLFMFRKAAKAARGLDMLEKRMALARETPATSSLAPAPKQSAGKAGGKSKKTVFSSSLIQEFVSSDGFPLWRGRNAEGNRALLKLANPFDYWLHVEDGPSAHLLVRRDHAAHDVPERTLLEAAALVGLKSWRKLDPKAPVMIALAKHVQPVKGAGPGTVRVHTQLRSVLATLDTTLETSLRRNNDDRANKTDTR